MRFMNLVELAPGVRPTGHFVDRAAVVKVMKARVGVGLQSALEVLQVLARVFALAVFRVSKPHGRRGLFAGWAFIAHIGPQAAGLGLARSRRQHRHGCIAGMNLASRQDMLAQRIHQRVE